MPDWLQLFALARFGRPLVLFAVLYAALWLGARALRLELKAWAKTVRALLFATAAAAFIAFISIALWYASDKRYYDFAEPTMPAVAWMFESGKPLYPPPDAAERYTHIYGPMAFIPLAAAMRLFGASLSVTKWLGAGAGLFALLLLFLILRSRVGTWLGLIFTGYCALLLLVFRNAAFWVRPDSLQLLCSSIGLWAALRRSSISGLALGLTAGVLWNLKFSGPLYTLPLFVLFFERTNRWQLALAIATAVVTVWLPFLFPAVSFDDYRTWILLSGRNGIVWSTLRQNLEWVAYVVAPLMVAVTIGSRQHPVTVLSRPVAISLAVALASVAVLASKPGAGPYHLLPFFPLITFLTALQIHQLRADDVRDDVVREARGGSSEQRVATAMLSFTGAAVLIALAQQTSFISTVRQIDANGLIADVSRFLGQHQDAVIQMGYSSDERMTFVRPIVVFRSGMYLLDQPAVQEHQLAGIEIPRATEDVLRSCAVTYWLIPKSGEPFSAINRYPIVHGRALFGSGFRRAFFASYRRSGSTDYFDVWTCAAAKIAR